MRCKPSPTSVSCVLQVSVSVHTRVSSVFVLALLVAPIARSPLLRRVVKFLVGFARAFRLHFVSQVRHGPVHTLPHLVAFLGNRMTYRSGTPFRLLAEFMQSLVLIHQAPVHHAHSLLPILRRVLHSVSIRLLDAAWLFQRDTTSHTLRSCHGSPSHASALAGEALESD